MTGQPEGQGKGIQRRGGNPKRESKVDNKDRSILRMIMSVRKAIHWVKATREGRMSQLVGGLVKSGQLKHLMSILLEQNWENTTTAGTRMGLYLEESSVTPLTQISDGSFALSRDVC